MALEPCIRCGSRTVDATEFRVSVSGPTEFVCLACGFKHSIEQPLESAIAIWNQMPRKSATEAAMESLAAATPTPLERVVCAILMGGRAPGARPEMGTDEAAALVVRYAISILEHMRARASTEVH